MGCWSADTSFLLRKWPKVDHPRPAPRNAQRDSRGRSLRSPRRPVGPTAGRLSQKIGRQMGPMRFHRFSVQKISHTVEEAVDQGGCMPAGALAGAGHRHGARCGGLRGAVGERVGGPAFRKVSTFFSVSNREFRLCIINY